MDSWASGVAWPISDKYPAAWGFFVVFVLLGSFGLLNLLTGVFIEALMEITRRHTDLPYVLVVFGNFSRV